MPNKFGKPTTYGDAAARIARVPILWDKFDSDNQSGQFQPQISLTNLLRNPSLFKSPVIQVDPDSPDNQDLGTTINHESVHALLDQLGDKASFAAMDQPNYPQMVQAIMQARRAGKMSQETPAYSLSNDSKVKFDPAIHMAFNQGFIHSIQNLDPRVAARLQQLGAASGAPGVGK